MALTGIFLCTFLIVHLVGNLQLFKDDSGQAFNAYAYFMTHFTPIKVVSYLLYTSIIIHALYALMITAGNKKARPVAYAMQNGRCLLRMHHKRRIEQLRRNARVNHISLQISVMPPATGRRCYAGRQQRVWQLPYPLSFDAHATTARPRLQQILQSQPAGAGDLALCE